MIITIIVIFCRYKISSGETKFSWDGHILPLPVAICLYRFKNEIPCRSRGSEKCGPAPTTLRELAQRARTTGKFYEGTTECACAIPGSLKRTKLITLLLFSKMSCWKSEPVALLEYSKQQKKKKKKKDILGE